MKSKKSPRCIFTTQKGNRKYGSFYNQPEETTETRNCYIDDVDWRYYTGEIYEQDNEIDDYLIELLNDF